MLNLNDAVLRQLRERGDKAKSVEIAALLGITAEDVNSVIKKLVDQKLAWKEGPGIVARITDLGVAHLQRKSEK